jgi:NitT/TauT family transport system substrate-binding protein
MKNKYQVSEECIACMACVEVAGDNFDMDGNQAFLKKQPINEEEEALCEEAMGVCPVEAISVQKLKEKNDIEPILASSNIKATLDKYPELKVTLNILSPKFKRMQNPALYNTLARFASFTDAAKISGVSICEILHALNKQLGVEEKLIKNMPECVQAASEQILPKGEEISWAESAERYVYNAESMPELIEKLNHLAPQKNLVYITVEEPFELLNVIQGMGLKFNLEPGREYRVSIFNDAQAETVDWKERKDEFEILDVRKMKTDPFDIILKKAYDTKEDSGFILIQKFEPIPMVNMLSEMGFEHVAEEKGFFEVWTYFHKKVVPQSEKSEKNEKPDVVIQSATPVAYPVMMRLLQSEKIRKAVNIKELKVWEETEKHLAWIANGKADISFSALITSAKLKNSDIKIPALFVWDNFVILARGYKARTFADLKGKTIHTPLFEEAPPTKITNYLIKASGLNPEDFNFVYGTPFGRPETIFADFVSGKADTVILREPEASYAIKSMQDRGEEVSILSYNKIWNEHNPGFGSFPNAGLVLKGEFVRQHPEITEVLLDELKKAIEWVNQNRHESAKLSYDMMRQPVDRVELFLNRVNFDYVSGQPLVEKVEDYFRILYEQGIVEAKVDQDFLDIFL